jgi:hypothetical protein
MVARRLAPALLLVACGSEPMRAAPPDALDGLDSPAPDAIAPDGPGPVGCTPGRVEPCPCGGAAAGGSQTCQGDGTFGACACPDAAAPDVAPPDAAVDAPTDAPDAGGCRTGFTFDGDPVNARPDHLAIEDRIGSTATRDPCPASCVATAVAGGGWRFEFNATFPDMRIEGVVGAGVAVPQVTFTDAPRGTDGGAPLVSPFRVTDLTLGDAYGPTTTRRVSFVARLAAVTSHVVVVMGCPLP